MPSRDHIHTVVRTPNGNDYGKDLLRRHYAQHGHSHGLEVHHHRESRGGGKQHERWYLRPVAVRATLTAAAR